MMRRFYQLVVLLLLVLLPAAALASEGEGAYGVHDPAEGFKHLWREVMIDITVIGIIFAIITVYMLFKYRRKHPDQEGKPPKLSPTSVLGWALIPVFVFMADDFFLAAKPILVRMTGRDVIHSMYLPDFKVKEDSMPGRITYLWFYPKEPGEHTITCAEYCGILHSGMAGNV